MILVDNRHSDNPYINLAIEEYLVRHADCSHSDLLFLYVNKPCIVLGKNQSIYKEVNFDFLRTNALSLCRRISGGGTVYHDSGNLNFAFISRFEDYKVNNYLLFNRPIVDALNKAGIPAEMDVRNNIVCNGKKISGNAQFTNRKNIISHGTLLVNANLPVLRSCLKPNEFTVETRAVSSVNSSVENIAVLNEQLNSVDALKKYLTASLCINERYGFSDTEWKEIESLSVNKFMSYEWVYGRSPFTEIKKQSLEIAVENGVIQAINEKGNSVLNALIGTRYSFDEIKKASDEIPEASDWLSRLF